MSIIAAISRRHGASTGGGGGGGQPVPPYLASIVVTGTVSIVATHTVTVPRYAQFDQYGAPFAGAPGPFTWRIANTAVATVVSATGIITGVGAGSTTITVETTNSLGQLIVSTPVALTGSAQVATTVTVTPPSATLTVSNTQQFTAVVYDQAAIPNVIAGASVAWDTTDHSKATSSAGGLVTAVANTTTPISVTATSGSAVGTAQLAVNASSTVTAVTLQYNGVPISSPLTPPPYPTTSLFRCGLSYPFSVKDQNGNVLTGAGVYSVDNTTDFQINSATGVLTPLTSAAGKAVVLTYTHTSTNLTATTSGTALLQSTPMASDSGKNYSLNQTGPGGFLANVNPQGTSVNPAYNSNVPTGNSSSRYTAGVSGGRVNQITIDNSSARLFMGDPVFNLAFVPTGNYPSVNANVPAFTGKRSYILTVDRFDPGYTMAGTVQGQAFAYKNAGWVQWQGLSGRSGVEWGSGTPTGGEIDGNCLVQTPNGGPTLGGQPPIRIGNLTTEFTGGQYFLAITLTESRANSIVASRHWRKPLGTAIGSALSGAVTNGFVQGPMVSLTAATPALQSNIVPMGANRNQNVPSEYDKQVGYWECVDGEVYGDPFGLFPNEPTATLTGITGSTVQPGDLNKTVVLTGTNFTANSEPRFSNSGVKTQSITLTNSTTLTCVVSLDIGASASNGTVLIYNPMTQLSTATQSFTVGAIVAPQAPTLSNATTVNNQTLTFPYTLNASGGVPNSLTWQYRETALGGAFIAGGSFTLVSPALGGSGNAQFILPKAATGYDVQAASTNTGGTSAYSATVTGTTGAAATLISTGLAVDWNPDTGTDVTTDGAGVGSLVDTIASATLFQGTAAKKPILKLAVYNGHNCIRFTASSQHNLTANAVLSALNSLDGTLYLVAKNSNNTPGANQRLFANYNFNGGSNVEGYFVNQSSGNTTVQVIWGKGGSNGNQGLTLSTAMTIASGPHQIATVFDHTTPAETPYFDGLATTAGAYAFVRQTTAPSFPSIGSDKGSANFWDGDFIRFLWYSTIHTPAQVAQNSSYLKTLYGLP